MRPPLIHDALAFGPAFPYMRAMQIPGHIDPVPVPRAVTPRADGRIDLLGLNKAQIRGCLEEAGLDAKQAKLRSKQLFHWLYHRGETDFAHMTDLAKPMRGWMAERFIVGRPQVMEAQVSTDGTRKWLLRSDDGQDYEMVFIPDADRGTLCVSSQVGRSEEHTSELQSLMRISYAVFCLEKKKKYR